MIGSWSLILLLLPFSLQQPQDQGFSVQASNASFVVNKAAEKLDQKAICDSKAVLLAKNGKADDAVPLRHCGFDQFRPFPGSDVKQHVTVELSWFKPISATIAIADYWWEWASGSSSHEEAVQVIELRDGQLRIVQQIDFNSHHGGRPAGAKFDKERKLLTIRAVRNDPFRGRCCPSVFDVVKYRWTGTEFVEIGRTTEPIPQEAP